MIKKSLSLVLIAAIVANLVVICLGHSHGSSDSPGQASHVHLFGNGHDHGHHDHDHHDHEGVDDHAGMDQSVSDSGLILGQHSTDHSSDVVYLADFDLRSTNNQDGTKEKNEIVVFFVSNRVANSANHPSPARLIGPKAHAIAPAHFLNTVRLLL